MLGVKMGLHPRLLYNTIRGAAGDSFMCMSRTSAWCGADIKSAIESHGSFDRMA